MAKEESHVMQYVGVHDSGADEWYCPICGRRFLMQMPPQYKRIILDPGDETVSHSGGIGGITMGSVEVESLTGENNNGPSEPEDIYLAPFLQWMDDVDFDQLWNRE